MRHWILGALAAALVLPGGIAAAQGGEPVDHPLAVRLGAMWPTKSEVRNAAGKSWFNAGLDYIFARTSEGNDWIGSLDYGTTSSINYWALQALYMWRNTGAISSSEKFSFGLGAGAYFLDTNTNSTQSESAFRSWPIGI